MEKKTFRMFHFNVDLSANIKIAASHIYTLGSSTAQHSCAPTTKKMKNIKQQVKSEEKKTEIVNKLTFHKHFNVPRNCKKILI